MSLLLQHLSKHKNQNELNISNIIHRTSNGIDFQPPKRKLSPMTLYENFTSFYLNEKNIFNIAGASGITMRLLPYKCYWSACNFCAINSTNLYVFRREEKSEIHKYIDCCIEFLRKHDVYHVVFIDEAIHPDVISYFADQIVSLGVDIRYQFRTRFELEYSINLCNKLYASGARYCGI
jgi:hypothetical protein